MIDGLHFVFQLVPDTEAPSEMHYYIKENRALCLAENVTHTMHNLYSLRGAKVRDSKAWAGYIDEMLVKYGDESDVIFSPTIGQPGEPKILRNLLQYNAIHTSLSTIRCCI